VIVASFGNSDGTGPAYIFDEKNLSKSLLISTLDNVIYYEGTIFTGLDKTSLYNTK
jgi:hypothetical protein